MQTSQRGPAKSNPLLQKPFAKNPPSQPAPPNMIGHSNQLPNSNSLARFPIPTPQLNTRFTPPETNFSSNQPAQFGPRFPPQLSLAQFAPKPSVITPTGQFPVLNQQHTSHNPLRGFGESRSTKEFSGNNLDQLDRSSHINFHPRGPSPPLRFGNNMFENYNLLLTEIKKKDDRIADIKNHMGRIKLSTNDQELRQTRSLAETKTRELAQLTRINQTLEGEKAALKAKLTEIEIFLQQKQSKQSKTQKLSQTTTQLNNELSSVKSEYETLRTKLNKMDYEAKMEYENQYRELMETKMFAIAMDAAKKSTNPEVQALYKRLELTQQGKGVNV